jgi:hypothetical protein
MTTFICSSCSQFLILVHVGYIVKDTPLRNYELQRDNICGLQVIVGISALDYGINTRSSKTYIDSPGFHTCGQYQIERMCIYYVRDDRDRSTILTD